jgi:photosystem II stability/assembly factor-like uncharacterized protein
MCIDPSNPAHITVFQYGSGLRDSTNSGTSWGGLSSSYTLTATDAPYLATGAIGGASNFSNAISWAVANPANTEIICQGWQTPVRTTYPITSPQAFTTRAVGIEQMASNGVVCLQNNSNPVLMQQDWGTTISPGPNSPPTTQGWNAGTSLSATWCVDWSPGSGVVPGLSSYNFGSAIYAKSSNDGSSWSSMNSPASAGDPYGGIAVASATNFVQMGQNDLYRTTDGGVNWTTIVNPGGVSIASGTGWALSGVFKRRVIAADRVNASTFYAFNIIYGLFRSTDGGVNWTQYNDYAGSSSPATMDPSSAYGSMKSVIGNAGHLFFSAFGGSGGAYSGPNTASRFWRSTNGGQTWSIVGPTSTSVDGAIVEVWSFDTGAIAPGQSYPAIYIHGWVRISGTYTQGVFRSIDNGSSWTQLTGPYPDGWCDFNIDLSADKLIYGRFYMAKAGSSFSVGQY